jgi:short-subunit dehydrogenase
MKEESRFWTIGKRLLLRDVIFNLVPTFVLIYLFIKRSEQYLTKGGFIPLMLAAVGIYTISKFFLASLHCVYIRKIRSPKIELHRYVGKWAIVSGASSAVGSAFAFKFAKKGINLCLIGRNELKLNQMAEYIKESKEYPNNIKITILVHDFANGSIDDFHKILNIELRKMITHFKATGRGEISFLVNCMNYRNLIPCIHHENNVSDIERMTKTNIEGALELVGTGLPYMKTEGLNNRKAIITVGSHSSYHPTPMMSLYSATNAYRTELMKYYFQKYQGDDGMHFLSVTPELMSLNMPRKRRNAAFVKSISAERIVNASLRNLGFQAEYFSFLGHAQSTVIPLVMWSHPWHRFLNKMKIARLEMLKGKMH